MLFSVIIPVYNGEEYLSEALQSIEKQTFRDFELIVVDDGSTDASGLIADEFARLKDNVHVLHGVNQGLILARRKGLSAANGEYVLFVDADDLLRDDALEIIAGSISKTRPDLVSFSITRKLGFRVSDDACPIAEGLYAHSRFDRIKKCVCEGRFNNLSGKAIRLCCIDRDTDYEPYRGLMHGEDLLQLLPIVDRCESLLRIDSILYYYRPNDSSSTAGYKSSQVRDIERVIRRLLSFSMMWGPEYQISSYTGEVRQYLSLLRLGVLSGHRKSFSEIRSAMKEERVFDHARIAALRPDQRFEVTCLRYGWRMLARFAILFVEQLKQWKEL